MNSKCGLIVLLFITPILAGCLDFGGGGTVVVGGCTDPAALNFNSAAEKDDGSCDYESGGPTFVDGLWMSPDGKGSLEIGNDGMRVLALSGNRSEAGYNHGYLMASEIVDLMNFYMVWHAGTNYTEIVSLIPYIDWGAESIAEFEAMAQGVRDRLPTEESLVEPEGLEPHEINAEDLMLFNALTEWASLYECSSFSIWGGDRGGEGMLYGRNFDYHLDPEEHIKDVQVVISYALEGEPAWVNVGMAGVQGCFSCINEYGVTAMTHVAHGGAPSDDEGFVPRVEALRRVIVGLDAGDTVDDAEAILEPLPTYRGSNYHVTFPADGRNMSEAIGVIEMDGNADNSDGRVTVRYPIDNPNLSGGHDHELVDFVVNTNHFVKRELSGHYSPGGSSARRYADIMTSLDFARADGNVTLEDAEEIMRSVGGINTIHTAIVEPDAMRIHVYYAIPGYGAFDMPPASFDFDDLIFPRTASL